MAASRKTWFNLTRNSAEEGTIDIFDVIGWGVTAADFVKQLRAMGSMARIKLNIDCPGGDCNDGFTIFDAIKATSAEVTANIMGVAASMASVIMLAARKITITENGRIMIHRVTSGGGGNADDLDAMAKVTRQFEDRIIQLYVARTGNTPEQIRDWMKTSDGTWFFGQEAVDHGFADEVLTGAKARAFNARWAPMFTMLPSALFDSTRHSQLDPALADPPLMKLTAEQKLRLHALLRKPAADHADAEKIELQNLSNAAAAENYDAAAAILAEDRAAAAARTAPFTAEQQTQITALLTAAVGPAITAALAPAVNAAVTTALAPITTRIENAERLLTSGIADAAGGRTAVKTGDGNEGDPKALTHADWSKLGPHARANFFRTGGKLIEDAA
jgi:ATP-dependent Clp endopeptidase proteolytic subunit ClpP